MPTLFDNSILVEIRASKGDSVCAEKVKFVESVFNKLQIRVEDALLTDRSFVEMIGYGKLRECIERVNEEFFEQWKKNISAILLERNRVYIKDVIDRYILALEKLFSLEFQRLLPGDDIYEITIENTEKYEFMPLFESFKSKLISYGAKLRDFNNSYKLFVGILVEDSVIRYLFDSVDIRQISPKLYVDVFDFLNQSLTSLMVKYTSAEILQTNLNLLMSVLKDNIEAQLKPGQKSQPLFRVYNDLADPELGYFPIYGKNEGGLLAPVTVVTKEPSHRVKDRLKYNFQSVGIKADVIGPQKLMTGRTVVLDFENRTYEEIITKDYIQEIFKYDSGKSIF